MGENPQSKEYSIIVEYHYLTRPRGSQSLRRRHDACLTVLVQAVLSPRRLRVRLSPRSGDLFLFRLDSPEPSSSEDPEEAEDASSSPSLSSPLLPFPLTREDLAPSPLAESPGAIWSPEVASAEAAAQSALPAFGPCRMPS